MLFKVQSILFTSTGFLYVLYQYKNIIQKFSKIFF